jgi:hypothetical protein
MTVVRCDLKDFPGRLRSDMNYRQARIRTALATTAEKGADYVKTRVPFAFKDLRDSVRAAPDRAGRGLSRIIADAPHAQAVEVGSRPHWAPIAPLLKWVNLRFKGLSLRSRKNLAYAIQATIAEKGTRPHWYMRDSQRQILRILDREIRRALPEA